MSLLDLLFPKRCVGCKKWGSYLCSSCFSYISFGVPIICLVCGRPSLDTRTHPTCRARYSIDGAVASIIYKGVVKKLIYSYKYSPHLTALTPLLVELLYEGLIQQEVLMKDIDGEKVVLVPVPLHSKRYRKRGYNQAALLAQGLSEKMDYPVIAALKRQKETITQYKLNRYERQQNMQDAFGVDTKYKEAISGKTVLLIDDVSTSGITLYQAARVLKKAGVKKVWGVALAHGQ